MFSWRTVVGRMFLLQLVLVLLLATGALFALSLRDEREETRDATRRSLAVAESLAHAPGIEEALKSADPTAVLQPQAEAVRKLTGLDFIVVVNPDGIRYTHPDTTRIGKPFSGDLAALRAGRTVTEKGGGPLGPQVRAVVPVRDADGAVIGAVSAGITIERVSEAVGAQLPAVVAWAAVTVAVITGGAALLGRRLLRQTHGLGPAEITRLYEHHEAVLHSVREGVLLVDRDRRLLLANDEAVRLLGLPAGVQGRPVAELGLAAPLAELLASGREVSDEVHPAGERLLAVNQRPLTRYGQAAGSVATLRDTTELRAVTGRAQAARRRLAVLYEAGVSIGTSLDVTRTAEELARAAVPQLADFVTVDLAEAVLEGEEPTVGEGQLRRAAVAAVREDHPLDPPGTATTGTARAAPVHAQIEPEPPPTEEGRRAEAYGIHSRITAPLHTRGTGAGAGALIGTVRFHRASGSEPFDADDLALAEELVARAAVCMDNARRYTREHSMAVTLQHSLLPRVLPEQSAMDFAYRYLPAEAGVGGDWFDVIPLSGARVALVVGDVAGHGIPASVTMGRLRTALRTLADIDLPPDELLTHLDDVVLRLGSEAARESAAAGPRQAAEVGATCLVAVHDPVTRRCTLARAGHPPPVLVSPQGAAEVLDLPAGPPLGLGGLPFESLEVELAEGSLLALYTDGLIETRGRDIEEELEKLRRTVAHPAPTLDELCDRTLRTLLPERPSDDVALLLARTRALGADQVATWDVPSDPAAVAGVRQRASDRLADWGLADAAFTTELVVSELVTNAIRYGRPPIQLRLIRDRALICEVSDASSTSPHLRRARAFDEGGRGLLLVAQLTQRWGTRHSRQGKTIWAEQDLPLG